MSESATDYGSISVAFKQDGKIVAIGNAGGGTAGTVSIHQYMNNNEWNLLTQLNGQAIRDEFGSSIAFNLDATKLIVAARSASNFKGKVSLFEQNEQDPTQWDSVGSIEGENATDFLGDHIFIDNDGDTILIVENNRILGSDDVSEIKMYEFNENDFNVVGERYYLSTQNINASLHGDGTKIAVVSLENNNNNINKFVKILELDKNDGKWSEMEHIYYNNTDFITAEEKKQYDQIEILTNISFSNDLNVLVVKNEVQFTIYSPTYSRTTEYIFQMYQYKQDQSNNNWEQIGNTIKTITNNLLIVSGDGKKFVYHDRENNITKVLEYNNQNNLSQIGNDINIDQNVADIFTSYDGNTIGIVIKEESRYKVKMYKLQGVICFAANSIVKTDQGDIEIQQLKKMINHNTNTNNKITINKINIKKVTSCMNRDNFLILIKKDALGNNCPNKNTLITKNHQIYCNNRFVRSVTLLGKYNRNIVKYYYKRGDDKTIYNICLANNKYSYMYVNNLKVETMRPYTIKTFSPNVHIK